MCDPETNTERRIPFLILSYFIMTLLFSIILNLNEQVVPQMNGYLVFFPYIMLFTIHLISIITELNENINEALIVIGLLTESLILSELKNGTGIQVSVPISILLLCWIYAYVRIIDAHRIFMYYSSNMDKNIEKSTWMRGQKTYF